MNEKIFRKECLDQITAPEQLHDYIKIARPGVWVVLSAIILIVAGAGIWFFAGELPTMVRANGLADDNSIICYLQEEQVKKMQLGDYVACQDKRIGTVVAIEEIPYSYDEILHSLEKDYYLISLGIAEWNYKVVIETTESFKKDFVYPLNIHTETIRPIDLLLR